MPHNAIASQAASATLLTPLAADRLNALKFYRQKYKCLVTINDGDGEGESVEAERKQDIRNGGFGREVITD